MWKLLKFTEYTQDEKRASPKTCKIWRARV